MTKPFVKVVKSGLGVKQKGLRKTDLTLAWEEHKRLKDRIKELEEKLLLGNIKSGLIIPQKVSSKNASILWNKQQKKIEELEKDVKLLERREKHFIKQIEELEAQLKEVNRLKLYWLKRATRWDSKRVKELEAQLKQAITFKEEWREKALKFKDEADGYKRDVDRWYDEAQKLPSKEPFIRGVGNKLNSSKAFAENGEFDILHLPKGKNHKLEYWVVEFNKGGIGTPIANVDKAMKYYLDKYCFTKTEAELITNALDRWIRRYGEDKKAEELLKKMSLFHCGAKPSGKISCLTHGDDICQCGHSIESHSDNIGCMVNEDSCDCNGFIKARSKSVSGKTTEDKE